MAALVNRVSNPVAGPISGPLPDATRPSRPSVSDPYPIRRCTTHGPRYIIEPDAAPEFGSPTRCCPLPVLRICRPRCTCISSRGVALAMQGESEHVIDALSERMRSLAAQQRFEEAAAVRDRLSSLLSATTTARLVDAVTCWSRTLHACRHRS